MKLWPDAPHVSYLPIANNALEVARTLMLDEDFLRIGACACMEANKYMPMPIHAGMTPIAWN